MMALGPARLRTLEALADALIPPGGPLPGGAEVGTAARAAELLARMPGFYRRALTAELTLLERLSIAGRGGVRSPGFPEPNANRSWPAWTDRRAAWARRPSL